MKKVLSWSLVLALGVALVSSAAFAKNVDSVYKSYARTSDWSLNGATDRAGGLHASAAATTLVLASYKFDSGATCTAQSWTTVDITQQTGHYWHIDDLAGMGGGTSNGGLHFVPIRGAHSLWMGARPAATTILCGYAALPGYGNGWNQAWCSKDCLDGYGTGSTTDLDVSFIIKFDSEPSYDATALQYTIDCTGNVGWTEIDGGNPLWTGADSLLAGGSYPVSPAKALTAAVAAGGTGYAVSDVLTLTGGTFSTATQLTVTTVGGGGAVTAVSISTAGSYSAVPANAVATSGGGGTGATFNMTWGWVNSVKVRLQFLADTSWSNQDGFYPGLGAMVDSLTWENKGPEGFEDEAVDATTGTGKSSNDWIDCNTPGYGNYLALFKKTCTGAGCTFADYRDLCTDNLSCYWAAILNSSEFYTCESPPFPNSATQRVVPHVNVRAEYISNEIWSPTIPLAGAGSDFRLRYTVYADLPLDNLIFHIWHVRTIDGTGCPGQWQDRNFVYYNSGSKPWLVAENAVGSKINVTTGVSVQVAIGVIDMCPFWCGVFGSGACHSPAPYLDQVKLLRIDTVGPQWDVRDLDTFNDNFATDGTITGTGRADSANDTKPSTSPTFTPGDSTIVLFLVDPASIGGLVTTQSGLSADPNVSTFLGRHKTKRACYLWVKVLPYGQAGKSGDPLSEGPGGQANRYPHIVGKDYVDGGGQTWTAIRWDYTYTGTPTTPGLGQAGTPTVPSRFNVDLNDNVFEPGDTVLYFYGATSPAATTYYVPNFGSTSSQADAAANAQEFTILPAGGFNRGGDILYVDGTDGFGGFSGTSASGNQPYFDGAFQVLGLLDKVDRFDTRGPSSGVSNRLGGRVYNVANQLNACYHKILWDCGQLAITLGDGSGDPEKTDDYALLNTFLDNIGTGTFLYNGGVYLCGDKVPQYLNLYGSASATSFRSNYMEFSLTSDDHRNFGIAISPKVFHWPGRCFSDDFVAFGGCPVLNEFDVLAPAGASLIEMSYTASMGANGAVLSHKATHGLNFAGVIMSGFSFAYIRDDELDGISDRAEHMHDIIEWLGNPLDPTTGAGPVLKNDLSQNYPNPFNPQTTIAFSLKERGSVSLKVYNVAGQLVRTLANENRAAGPHTVVWDGRNNSGQPVSSGVYFYKLVANNFSQTKKMVLLK